MPSAGADTPERQQSQGEGGVTSSSEVSGVTSEVLCVCVWVCVGVWGVYEYRPNAEGRLVIASRLLDPRDQLRPVAPRDGRKNATRVHKADFPSADTETGGRRKPRGTAF